MGGDAQVLASECDIVADSSHHRVRVRVLQHQTDPAAGIAGGSPPDQHYAFLIALVGATHHPRDRLDECRLARTGGAQ